MQVLRNVSRLAIAPVRKACRDTPQVGLHFGRATSTRRVPRSPRTPLEHGHCEERGKLRSVAQLETSTREGVDYVQEDEQEGQERTAEVSISRPPRKASLLEELFPEDVKKSQKKDIDAEDDLPRLPLPDLPSDDDLSKRSAAKTQLTKQTQQSLRHEDLTILVLSRISMSLVESDFRRVAPKGAHINQWRGAGDILEIIPGRSPVTLQPTGLYFLVFRNAAYAQIYQKHVLHLHSLAKQYTRKSLESPPDPPPGRLINDEDVYSLLQDFALCPPSARLSLRVLIPPYHHTVKTVLNDRGYKRIVSPDNKSGRSVLFWVEGIQPSAFSVRTILAKNGQERGLQWGPLRGCGSIDMLDLGQEVDEEEDTGVASDVEIKPKKPKITRWIIAFEDEPEARRFIRVWHRQPYPYSLVQEKAVPGEPASVVHAEFLW